jgi:P4 family phage/plasmid primase-like protien
MPLAAHHEAMLAASDIAPEVIVARGYWTATTKAELARLGFPPTQQLQPALVVPIYNVRGELSTYMLRPDAPRIRDSKPAKYEFMRGFKMVLDVPNLDGTRTQLDDPRVPLWVTEGSKKVDALVSHGCCGVGVIGVWSWRGSNEKGGKVALADWELIALNDRVTYICYDSDVMVKREVYGGLCRLAEFLALRHAHVRYVYLPSGASGAKIGVDDYLAGGHTVDDLLGLATPERRPQPVTRQSSQRDVPDELPYSDYTNALAMVEQHGPHLRYCYPWKAWLVWTGTHWERDTRGRVMRLAKEIIKQLARRVEMLDDDEIAALLRHIKTSLATQKLKAMVESVQSEEGIPLQPEELDRHPWLLNCANGTLDLQTGILHPHQQVHLLSKFLPLAYDAHAVCPTWEAFLWRIMGGSNPSDDLEDDAASVLEARHRADDRATRLIAFLQRAIGYSLTGQTKEQCFFLLYGSGSNGKSTFLEVLQALLHEYAQSTPSASLIVKERHDGIPNDIARLRGARLVTCVEIGEGRRLNEELVKRLTGQDTMSARFLHAEFFDFMPEFKLFLACNHLPVIRGTEHAIWRRIKCIPFAVTIPVGEQDKDLAAKLKAELPGILTWAVQGCLDWQHHGLEPPEEVEIATKDYRASMDVLGAFIAECCLIGPSYRTKASDLYDAYKRWCEQQGETAAVQRNWSMALAERGHESFKVQGRSWWRGIALFPHEQD